MKFWKLGALGRSVGLRTVRLAATSLLVLHLTGAAWAQDEFYEEPAYEEPAYEEPAYEEPAYEEPAAAEVDPNCAAAGIYDWESCNAYLSGGGEEPAYDEPQYEEPAYEEPASEEPAYEEPAYEDPSAEEPAYEEPAYDEPTAEEDVYQQEEQEQQDFDPAAEAEDNYDEPALEEDTTYQDETSADDEPVYDDTQADDETVSDEEAGFAEDAVPQDEAGPDDEGVAEDEIAPEEDIAPEDAAEPQLFTEEEAEAFDAEPFVDDGGVQEEVIEDLPGDIDATDISPVLDSVKEYGSEAEAEAPEFVPEDDYDAQQFDAPEIVDPLEGEDYTSLQQAQTAFEAPEGVTIIDNSQTTVIYEVNNTTIINNYYEDQDRLAYGSDSVDYYSYADGSYSESIIGDDGSQVITIRDRYGNVISRTYYDAYGNEHVLAWYDPSYREDERMYWGDAGYNLPPLLVTVPRGDYIFFYDKRDQASLRRFFQLPPVEPVRQLYTIDEVKRSARLRDSLPRVEISDLTFANGSATISRSQAEVLRKLAQAMLSALKANPAETFLIEGHTDAPGSERDNLKLSDARAAAVARALTEYYGVPPWNLTTQGYGERYLKVQTSSSLSTNRRVTIRRITPLVTTASR